MSTVFIVFITIFFSLYLSLNYYVFRRAKQALIVFPKITRLFSWLFWLFPLSIIIGRIAENWFINFFSSSLIWIGSIWLGALTYFVFACLIIDIIKISIKVFKIEAPQLNFDPTQKFKLGIFVVIVVFGITTAGTINAFSPVARSVDINIEKKSLSDRKNVSVLMASDIHLGTLVGKKRFNKLVKTINSIQPDMVIFAGDIIDEDLAPVIKQDMGAELSQIKPPLGFFGITGNHKYIGGVEPAVEYLSDHGIKILRDQVELVDNSFYIVGREDLSSERMGGKQRKSLEGLFFNIPEQAPTILIDHQPFNLNQVSNFGKVDFQVSGHTHNGQLWPFNFVVDTIYELAYGYKKIGNTHFYVSNGFGTWGPPMRVGNRPEIVIFNINFK